MSRPYSDEVSVSYEKQIWRDLRVNASYYYRTKKNLVGLKNLAILPSDYAPISTINGQPITNPITGQPMTLYNLDPAKVGHSNILLTNIPQFDDNAYHGLEFDAIKRMSNRWQLLAGFTIQRQKGAFCCSGSSDDGLTGGDNVNDPNLNIN